MIHEKNIGIVIELVYVTEPVDDHPRTKPVHITEAMVFVGDLDTCSLLETFRHHKWASQAKRNLQILGEAKIHAANHRRDKHRHRFENISANYARKNWFIVAELSKSKIGHLWNWSLPCVLWICSSPNDALLSIQFTIRPRTPIGASNFTSGVLLKPAALKSSSDW